MTCNGYASNALKLAIFVKGKFNKMYLINALTHMSRSIAFTHSIKLDVLEKSI